MISFLQGTVQLIQSDNLILNVNGVGYDLACSSNTLEILRVAEKIQLWVHTHVREDTLMLFGFLAPVEKELFMSLIKVNGIGPKMAIKVLSAARTEVIVDMIEQGDAKGLTKLPKIGKKTAEQIVLTLKGKLVFAEERGEENQFQNRGEIISALVNLGFKSNDVEKVVNDMDPTIDLQVGVRNGLSALTAPV